ncbi:MAG: hypothetical protein J6J36_07085 [Clostridia bacterium]|nr:hypothetical protein [Clostridia bacterium]
MSENINMVDALLKTIYNQDQRIAELEAKLVKSNENVKLLAETRVAMCDTIKDLEEKLKNAIVPKFKVGQEVYAVSSDDIYVITIDSITIEKEETHTDFVYYDVCGNGYDWVYVTKEEALKKLEELKG